MRSLPRKQVRADRPLWVRVPRLPLQETTRALGRAAKVPGFQPGEAGSTPAGHSYTWVGSSAAERSPVKRQRVGSSPARPSHIAGCLLVDRRGFEPRRRGFDSCTRNFDDSTNRKPMRDRSMAGRGALNAVMLVQVQLPQLRHCRFVRATARMSDPASRTTTEVNRPDEEPVLKTGAGSRS
jgi:hypothetical protein